jgi:CBS domain-containing protein
MFMANPKDLRNESSSARDISGPHKGQLMRLPKIEAIMTSTVATIAPEGTLYDAARLMGEKRIGSLIVMKYDTPVGIITERDLLNVVNSGVNLEKDWIGGSASIREVKVEKTMSFPLVAICIGSSIKDAARMMIEKRIRRLAVCDSGKLAGIVTTSDMISILPKVPETMKKWFEVDYFMTKQVITANENVLLEEAAALMAEKRVGSVIVTSKGKPIGIFTERDLLTNFLANDKSLVEEVGNACSSPLITGHIGISVHDAAVIMATKHIRRLPITKDNEIVGVLSARDLLEVYARG